MDKISTTLENPDTLLEISWLRYTTYISYRRCLYENEISPRQEFY